MPSNGCVRKVALAAILSAAYRGSMSVFELVINAFNRTGARFVVVGGFGVNLRGYQRFTSDLDVMIDLAPRSAELLIEALEAAGFKARVGVSAKDFADPSVRQDWIERKGAKVISFVNPAHPTFAVDVFVDPPLEFERVYLGSSEIPLGNMSVRVASAEDLIEMKKIAGRPADLDDIAALELLLKDQQ